MGIPCRVYAPVGSHEDLLAYLVRRLLENGANTSFVNRIVDEKAPLDAIVADPIMQVRQLKIEAASRHSAAGNMFGRGAPEFGRYRSHRSRSDADTGG